MKKQLIYSALSLWMMSACSVEETVTTMPQQKQPENVLKVTVSSNDFVIDGKTGTRATDKGKETVFEVGDKVGLIVLEEGTPIKDNNLPYVYDGTGWDFDELTAQNEGSEKSIYYSNTSKNSVTYIVYFPYNKSADEVVDINDLKACFTHTLDQSSESAYRASDLMVWTKTGVPITNLEANLTHAYSSFSLSLIADCTLADKASTKFPFIPEIYDLKIFVGDQMIKPFSAEDGSYRYILPDGYTGDVRWFYELNSKNYAGSRNVSGSANVRYSQIETVIRWRYDFTKAQSGDFYCVNDGQGYLVPKSADADFLKTVNCVGIVFYVGNVVGDNYGLLDNKFSHGLVSALWEGVDSKSPTIDKMTWDYGTSESVSNWLATATWNGVSRPTAFTSIAGGTKAQGYANTLALRNYNASVGADSPKRNKIVESLDKFIADHPVTAECSGWYCPSEFEAKALCWGQGSPQGSLGRNTFNEQLLKYKNANEAEASLRGVEILDKMDYWTSTEVGTGNNSVINMNYQASGWYGTNGSAKNKAYKHRPVFAF